MTNEEYASLIAGYSTNIEKDTVQEKITKLNERTVNKLHSLGTKTMQDTAISGLYDADSPVWANPNGRKTTARLSGDGYYVNAPELKINDELNPAGINARIQADNYAMGVDAPNFPEGEGLDPKYYKQYVDAMNPALAERQAEGNYAITPLDKQGRYGRELITAQSKELPISQTDYLLEKGQGVKKFTNPNVKKLEGAKALKDLIKAQDKGGRFEEAIDLTQSEGLKLWADMSKAARSATRGVINQFGGDPDALGFKENTRLLGTDELVDTIRNDTEVRDAITGYGSRAEWAKEQEKFQEAVKDSKYGEAVWNVVTNLDRYLAQSAPEMGLLLTPYAGLPSLVGTRLNNQMEEFEKNNNRPMTTQEAIGTAAAITATLVPEKILVKTGATSLLNNLIKGTGGVKKGAIGVGISAGGEALQEGAEAIQEQYATQKIGEQTLREIASNPETVGGVIAGGVMGGALRGTGEVATEVIKAVPGAIDVTKKGIEKATETPVQRKQRETREFSAPLQEEAVNSVIIGNTEEVVSKVDKMHGKLSNLDESADKKRTYGTVIKNALDKAIKSGDENAINGVYKTIAELDKGKNDFQAKDLVDEITYSATQEYLKIINENVDTSDSKMQGLRDKSVDEIKGKAELQAREGVLAKIKQLEALIADKERRLKSVKGSESFTKSIGELTKLKEMIGDYLKGKDTAAVNSEFAELGFIVAEGENGLLADPNRPGLTVYERELTNKLLDPEVNKNLLNEKVSGNVKVTLTGLTNFAKGRLRKLQPTSKKEAFQTKGLINRLFQENEQMLKTINNVLITAKGLKELDTVTKKSYEVELKNAAKVALEANKELTVRKGILDSIDKEGTYIFHVATDGTESIQKVTGKDSKGEFQKVKYADIVDNKAVPIKEAVKVEPVKMPETIKEQIKELKEKGKTKDAVKAQLDADSTKTPELRSVVNKYVEGYYSKEPVSEGTSSYKTMKETEPKVKPIEDEIISPRTPLSEVRSRIAYVNERLSNLIANVPDMEVKEYVKDHYNKRLGELQEDRTRLGKLINRLEKVVDARVSRKYNTKDKKLMSAIVGQIDNLVNKMLKQITRLGKMLKNVNKKYREVAKELQTILDEINAVEKDFASELVKTTIGTVTTIDETLYGKPILEVEGKRTVVEKRIIQKGSKTGKPVAQSTAINDALEVVKEDKIAELLEDVTGLEQSNKYMRVLAELVLNKDKLPIEDETFNIVEGLLSRNKELVINNIKKVLAKVNTLNQSRLIEDTNELITYLDSVELSPEGETSLGAKVISRLLINFPMNSSVHKILGISNDSVFGKLAGNPFANTNKLLEMLPSSFREFFANDKESRAALVDNIKAMAKYIDNTEIGVIKIGDKRLVKNINNNGLAMFNREKDGKVSNFPVEILELIGTVKNGELQIDEQTKNILKFYTAKMLSDSQIMISKILSFDESEMSQYLGIVDPDEQVRVKQEAADGYVNSASIRKDIGSEVYQALGVRLSQTTPEFTEESFKSALGVLVQAILTDNGSMESKTDTIAGKNQTLLKANWDVVYKNTIKDNEEFNSENVMEYRHSIIKSINKLQYMNESRNRPLPSLREPKDDNNRVVMNTQNIMDKKSMDFLNKQEKIAYTISPEIKQWLNMDEKNTLKSMGYIEIADLHVSEVDAQIARNDKLVREWEILKTFAKAVGDKKFYLKWGQTVSGRYTMLNDIQYQESKLHREFIVAEGSVELVDPTTVDGRQMLEASIMQGLDMDPDKLSAETASENFNKLFKVTDKGIDVVPKQDKDGALDKTHVTIKKAYETLRDESKIDVDAMAEVFASSEGHHGISSIGLLVKWNKALIDGVKVRTHANLEIDAITSGMILILLQIGSDQAIRLAEKGGVYTSKRRNELEKYVQDWLGEDVIFTPGALIEAGKKHATAIEDPENPANADAVKILYETKATKDLNSDEVFKDMYSTIGVAMIGEVKAYKAKLEEESNRNASEVKQLAMLNQIGVLNLKNIRSIAKSPVMVYIYGAKTSSIKKKLTYSLGVNTFIKTLKKASNKLKNSEGAKEELDFINTFVRTANETYVNEFGVKVDKPKERWEQLLALDIQPLIKDIEEVINATFGNAIEKSFEDNFGFIDKNRNTAKAIEVMVFEAYQIRLADEVKLVLDAKYGTKHNGEMYKLSKEELQNINNKLTAQGFGHNIVWYEKDGTIINQSLNKTGDKGGTHSTSVTVGNTKVGGQIKQSKPAVNTGAAPTISIHAIDGRMMLDVLNREIKDGKYTGGNVYDAVLLSLNKTMLIDTAKSYNTNMIETGFSRSIIADQVIMLDNMLVTMSNSQKKRMLDNIGLRPKGELKEDYTKETNRIELGTGKMLESLEASEEVNKERIRNSSKEYYSGHLYQMGSEVVKVGASETRAKQFPEITAIKALLNKRLEQDRIETYNEFAKAGVKLHERTSYVLNVEDILKGKTQIKSKANIVQIKDDSVISYSNIVKTLSKKDTLEIVGKYEYPSKPTKQSKLYDRLVKAIEKTGANMVIDGKLVEQYKVETKIEEDIIDPIEYVEDALRGKLNQKSKDLVSKITDKQVLDKVIENIKCRKGV